VAKVQSESHAGKSQVVAKARQEAAQPVQKAGDGLSVTDSGARQASTVPPPDYEAHFTLGVAYKNMGLFREAREEFDRSKEGEAYYLDSSLMTGLCHKEEGHLAQAIKGLEIVLADPRCHGTKGQAIRYELGLLYEAEAQWGKAVATFQSIPSFHDVPQRLAALKTHQSSEGKGLRLAG
jgi:tetratricopeptide (TPR) repeat protein